MRTLHGMTLLGQQQPEACFDIGIENRLVVSVLPSRDKPQKRLLAMPALVNAHDHARPLSTTSFGLGGRPLESWLPGQSCIPPLDPYLAALVAFGHAARAGAGTVMVHYTRLYGPMPPIEEVGEVARAARDVGIRVAFALFMRDRNPLVYGPAAPMLDGLPAETRAIVEQQFFAPMPSIGEQIKRVEDIAAAHESDMFQVQFGPNGVQWCSDELLSAIGDASAKTGRRVHMHLLETRYQREFADKGYEEGVVNWLSSLGLLNERVALAHSVYARPDELDLIAASGAVIVTNPGSNLHLRSGIAPIGEVMRRGVRVCVGVDGSALDEDDDILREMRLAHLLHSGWGYERNVSRYDWIADTVRHGRFALGAPGDGSIVAGNCADIVILDLDQLDKDAVSHAEPIDLLFGRANQAHIVQMVVAGRDIVRDRELITINLAEAEASIRAQARSAMPSRAPFRHAWSLLEPRIAGFYAGHAGCC